MITLALSSVRTRPLSMTVIALVGLLAPIILTIAGTVLATAIVVPAPPHAYTAPIVIAGPRGFKLPDQQHQTVAYGEGSVVSDELERTLRADRDVDTVEVYVSHQRRIALGVTPRPGPATDEVATRLRLELGRSAQVLTGSERGLAEDPGIAASRLPLIISGAVTAGTMTMIIALVAFSALSLTIGGRRREIALLSLVGATPRQVRRLVTLEVGVVGSLSATVGTLVGPTAASATVHLLAARGLISPLLQPTGQELSALASWLVTVTILTKSASIIMSPASRTRADGPAWRDQRSGPSPLRRSLAKTVAAVAAAMVVAAPFLGPEGGSSLAGPAVLVALVAVGLAAPELVARCLRVLRPITDRMGLHEPGGDEIVARAGRLGSVATLLAIGVALFISNVSAAYTTADSERPQFPAASASIDVPVVDETAISAAEAAAGPNATVSASLTSTGWIETPYDKTGSDPLPLIGVNHAAQFIDAEVVSGTLGELTGTTIAITVRDANRAHLAVGDVVGYRFGDGAAEQLTVVAILAAPRAQQARLVSYDLLSEHVRRPSTTILIRSAHPVAQVDEAMRDQGLNARASVRADEPGTPGGNLGSLIYLAVAVVSLAFSALVAVNSVAALTLSRRGELWAWQLVGATRRQCLVALMVEISYVGVIAVLAGGAIGLVTATSIGLGFGGAPTLPPLPLGIITLTPALFALLTTWITALRATRTTRTG